MAQVQDKCSCGQPFAFRVGKIYGPWYWCWTCDGHKGQVPGGRSECAQYGKPVWRCKCRK